MERQVFTWAAQRPVVIFSRSTDGISHSIRMLLTDFGVNPAVYELDQIPRGREIEQVLYSFGCTSIPAVFIGGELVGGSNEIMTLHLNQSLIPMLKRAKAIWV